MDPRTSTSSSFRSSHDRGVSGVAAEAPHVNRSSKDLRWTPFLRDVAKMVDLQMRLLSIDLQEFVTQAKFAGIITVIGSVIAVASLPVLLLGLCQVLVLYTELNLASACMLVGGVTLIGALIATGWGVSKVMTAGNVLHRTREELSENLEWVREVLHGDES